MGKIEKKQIKFRLKKYLIERIKENATKEKTSVNNYVETLLLDALFREPNDETLSAMREIQSDKELDTLDMSNFNSFMKSLNEIK